MYWKWITYIVLSYLITDCSATKWKLIKINVVFKYLMTRILSRNTIDNTNSELSILNIPKASFYQTNRGSLALVSPSTCSLDNATWQLVMCVQTRPVTKAIEKTAQSKLKELSNYIPLPLWSCFWVFCRRAE